LQKAAGQVRRMSKPGIHPRRGRCSPFALDTLFLTMPISWRGTLAQYGGRLHRLHASKRDVIIYDYVDENEPLLAKMASKREVGYRSLGYRPVNSGELGLKQPSHAPELWAST